MDRLAEFRAARGRAGPGGASRVVVAGPPAAGAVEAAEALEAFRGLAAEAAEVVGRVAGLTRDVSAKHREAMSAVDVKKGEAAQQEVEELMEKINNAAQTTSQLLERMKQETEKLKATPETESRFIGVIRIEENQRRYILFRLNQAMREYQKEQDLVKKMYRAQTERQIKIKYTNSDGSAIDDETAKELALEVLENNMTTSIFWQSRDVLDQIIETRNDIYRIEQSMRLLNQLFNDLAFLVHEQGEIMDVVQKNIENATRFVVTGRQELKKARKYQRRSRRKLCCLLLVLAAIVALFAVAVALGFLL